MEPNPKRRKCYSICPHCKKELNIKRYKEHKRLYFNKDTKQWIVDDSGAKSSSVPEDSSSSDCFSSLDEGDTGDLNNLAMQQEEINSDMMMYDLDDLTEHSSDGTKFKGAAQRPKSPPQGMCTCIIVVSIKF